MYIILHHWEMNRLKKLSPLCMSIYILLKRYSNFETSIMEYTEMSYKFMINYLTISSEQGQHKIPSPTIAAIRHALKMLEKHGLIIRLGTFVFELPYGKYENLMSNTMSNKKNADEQQKNKENNYEISTTYNKKSNMSNKKNADEQHDEQHTLYTLHIHNINHTSSSSSFSDENDMTKTFEKKEKSDSCPHQAIIDLYHELLPELPRVMAWRGQRMVNLRSRWKEQPDLNKWRSFFKFVKQSDFLMGRVKQKDRKTFKANLEWLVKQSNFDKIMEHKYVNE